MKKMLAMLMAVAMVLSLAACGSSSDETDSSDETEESETTEEETEEEEAEEEAETEEEEETEESETEEETEEEEEEEEVEFAEEPTYSLRMSTESSDGEWLSILLQDWADDVYEATNGEVYIELYLNNTLGDADTIWSWFTEGTVEVCYGAIGHAGSFPVSDIVQTPFVCSSEEDALNVMYALEEAGYLTEFTDNMYVCFYMPTLPQEMMFVDREVTEFEDLSGMVIRASSSPLISCVEAFGSTATSIAITDLYLGLSQGVADGTITSVDAAETFSLQDVVKYLLDMPISYGMGYTGINLDTWNSFSEEIQTAIEEVNEEYQELFMEENEQADEDCRATMVEGGLTILEPSDELVADCEEATEGLVDDYIDTVTEAGYDGEAIIEIVNETVSG